MATGAERDTGETQANSTPCAASSSTKVAAKLWVTSDIGSSRDSGAWDARLSYFVAGDGPAVTLLHGFTQSGRSWRELISRMPEGWQWIVPDLRGHGETRVRLGATCSMDACTDDLLALWDELGVERSHVAGYSMGGRLALHVAALAPGPGLCLLTLGA